MFQLVFLIVAIILFILAAIPIPPASGYHGTLVAAGLAFFAASFLPI
jgi:hypothetical protein